MLKNIIVLWLSIMPCLAFAQQGPDAAMIRSSRMASNKALAHHDISGMAKYWLPDFVQTIGRGTSLTGKDTIIAVWQQLFKSNATVLYIRKPLTIAVGDNGIMAWETGVWEAKNSYSKGGNYSAMWRKIDGEWKLQAELFVSLRKL
jgi:ketosteroid isomerase-like protein